MTAPPSHSERKDEKLTEAVGAALREVISARTGSSCVVRADSTQNRDDRPRAIGSTVAVALAGEWEGELFLTLDTKVSTLGELQQEASKDLAQAWLSLALASQTSLAACFPNLTFTDFHLRENTGGSHFASELRLQGPEGVDLRVALAVDTALAEALSMLSAATSSAQTEVSGEVAKLSRVIDVPLSVTLRFGQRQLTLREVLALGTGSLVELDRQVEEPVDLVLGDRLIARGEVVVVDGNYGLRVTEVVEGAAHRIERLGVIAAQGNSTQGSSHA